MRLIDLRHLGNERVIGSWLVGDVLIDPGPETCLRTLLEALDHQPPRVIALTHIHLDHAGATGSLLRRFPQIEVWVHRRGARHLIDPSKLLASASRLYRDDMDRLWGEVLPVPAEKVRSFDGGERVEGFAVAYTPGHAYHHVSYLHEDSGTAFCGDVAGVRIDASCPVLPPTPPPDIDLPAWRESLQTIAAWQPSAIVATHFGRYEDSSAHLAQLAERLRNAERLARTGSEAEFASALQAIREALPEQSYAVAYNQAMPADQSYAGLRRYIERA